MPLIEPRVLKGFRDFLPSQELARRRMVGIIEDSFRSFGFVPIDTPALEYAEILLGKGGGETEKQVYRFTDQGGRDVALRFDLTVPFARFTAEHRGELVMPFRRYHIAKVWRGENTQRGRYREFTQCDFDILGESGPAADFEILLMMKRTLTELLAPKGAASGNGGGDAKPPGITIRVNHRGLFNRFLSSLGLADRSVEILRQVDKLAKAGRDAVGKALEAAAGTEKSGRILDFVSLGGGGFDETLESLRSAAGDGEDIRRLLAIRRFMKDAGETEGFVLDPSVTRGLDYYTGVVYESFLDALPGIGSVCSGGRYDNLTGLYAKEGVCGVGASIGLDRLQAALEELGAAAAPPAAAAALACPDEADAGRAHKTAALFRRRGLSCEVFYGADKITRFFMLAEKKGIPWVIIPDKNAGAGPGENKSAGAGESGEGGGDARFT
ncbi:MAG: histidine--tRNA ligase, partial [Treponema sp.]|nr:histidine--tRNA ligase [Treponema sp.]